MKRIRDDGKVKMTTKLRKITRKIFCEPLHQSPKKVHTEQSLFFLSDALGIVAMLVSEFAHSGIVWLAGWMLSGLLFSLGLLYRPWRLPPPEDWKGPQEEKLRWDVIMRLVLIPIYVMGILSQYMKYHRFGSAYIDALLRK